MTKQEIIETLKKIRGAWRGEAHPDAEALSAAIAAVEQVQPPPMSFPATNAAAAGGGGGLGYPHVAAGTSAPTYIGWVWPMPPAAPPPPPIHVINWPSGPTVWRDGKWQSS